MANIVLTVTPSIRIFPFVIPPGAIQPHTAVPRARLTFQAKDVTIVAKIATNTTSITMLCTLPANFAYTFEYATMRVNIDDDATDADNFEDLGGITFGFGDLLGSRRCELLSDGILRTDLNAGSEKNWVPINPYVAPMFNQEQATVNLTLNCNDTDAGATNEGLFSAVLTVLQYDFDQTFNYPVNFPVPVSAR